MRKNPLRWPAEITIVLIILAKFVCAGPTRAARGRVAALPTAADLVPNGAHFLVRIDDELSTRKMSAKRKFDAHTIEPLETSGGHILPPGAKVHGHVSLVEPGSLTGRARLWLAFDDIDTRHGRLPNVAEVSSVPGDFSVRPGQSREGEIEARTRNGTKDLEAAVAGAAIGAAAGVAAHDGKAAALGAVAGGIAGFMSSSGIGQELDLPKGTKLDLILDRPLFLNQ